MRALRALLILAALGLASGPAQAQSLWALVVANCGTPPVAYNPGYPYQVLMDTTGKLCESGAVTLASGAVAAGAYSSGAFAAGALASGSLAVGAGTDGWDVTEGAKADAACGGSTSSCTVEARLAHLEALLANVGSPFQASGSIGNTNFGGYDSGTAATTPATPANASHTAGQSVGGLYALPYARTNGGSGLLEHITLMSVGGDTPTLQVRLWDRAPTNSNFACTDNAAYAAGSGSTGGTVVADQAHLLTPPFTITLAAPTAITGDAYTYASYQFAPPLSFKNQDSPVTNKVYACLQATVTYTPTASPYVLNVMGLQD